MTLSRNSTSDAPHVWTQAEIEALPRFGGTNGWFFGFVHYELEEGEHTEKTCVLAEILPGMGWSFIDPPNAEEWEMMQKDLAHYRPDTYRSRSVHLEGNR